MNTPKVIYTIGDQVFTAKPKPPTQTLFICGCRDADESMLSAARFATLRVYRMFVQEWRVVVGDGHGIDAEVMMTCQTWSIPFLVCGTAKRPTNGAPMKNYQRVVSGATTQAEKQAARDRFMAQLATEIVYFGPDVHLAALHLGKMPHWLYETQTV